MWYRLHCPIHKDGWVFGAIFVLVTILLGTVSAFLGWVGLIATVWCIYFFRDPHRVVPVREGLVVSPADGRVCQIAFAETPPVMLELKGSDWTRVSIFLDIFDVHVNRIPIGGRIIRSVYHAGKFLNASLDKASEENERQSLVVETADKRHVAFVQIAGLIARRIRCDVREDQAVQTGERYGLIRFGSRADIYLPRGVNPLVCVGQRMISGETIIADMMSGEPPRVGEQR